MLSDKLEKELDALLQDSEENISIIENFDSTYLRGVKNSELAITTAKKLLRISEILSIYEKEE